MRPISTFVANQAQLATYLFIVYSLGPFQLVANTLKSHCQYKYKFAKTKAYWVIKSSADIRCDMVIM